MHKQTLYTDASVNTKSKIGYGVYLLFSNEQLSLEELKLLIKLKRFEQTSSTKLELQTLIWALNEVANKKQSLTIHTDSQNIINLPARRKKLEANKYCTKKNTKINNYKLYKEFYKLTDKVECEFIKLKGHIKSDQKTHIDQIFAIVDRASRKALRESK